MTLAGQVVSEEDLWDCTTCRACMQVRPVVIRHPDVIVEMRRDLIYEGQINTDMRKALSRTASCGNPWGVPWNQRTNWSVGLDVMEAKEDQEVEILYWVGCAASFDARAQEIAKSMVKILKKADVNFAILGNREMCTGEAARRIGDEGLFQTLALLNIETLKRFRFCGKQSFSVSFRILLTGLNQEKIELLEAKPFQLACWLR